MKKKVILVITVFIALITFVLVGNSNTRAFAQGTNVVVNGVSYNKISTLEEITNGEYIIGYETNYACGEEGTNKYISKTNVENEAIPYTFTGDNTNGFKIQNSVTKEYFSYLGCSKNKLAEEPNEADALTFTFEVLNTGFIVKSSNNRYLKYNTSAPRFALYTSSIALDLYKKSDVLAKTYKVSFNTMGGNILEDLIMPENDTLDTLPIPDKAGYEFVGWYKEETLTNAWDVNVDKLTSDITLYAKWVEAPYINVLSLADIESAEYYFEFNDQFVNEYSNQKLMLSNDFTNAIKFKFLEIEENKVIISFILNGKTTYLNCVNKTDVLTTNNFNEAYIFTLTEANGQVLLNGESNRSLRVNDNYLRFYTGDNYKPVNILKVKNSQIDLNDELIKLVDTKASLKVDYDTTTLTATDIDLRFGTIIPSNLYNPSAKYGVVAVKKSSNITLNNGLQTEGNINDFIMNNIGAKAIEAKPEEVNGGMQFAWVINNIEEQELKYNTTFIASVYMELNGKLYLSNSKEASVVDVCNLYINDQSLNIPTNVIEVLKKLV